MNGELPGTGPARRGGSLLGRVLATLTTFAMVVVGLMFSVAFLAIAVAAAALFLGWLWWKTRRVRRQMQTQASAEYGASADGGSRQQSGNVIEGEVLKGEWKRDQDR